MNKRQETKNFDAFIEQTFSAIASLPTPDAFIEWYFATDRYLEMCAIALPEIYQACRSEETAQFFWLTLIEQALADYQAGRWLGRDRAHESLKVASIVIQSGNMDRFCQSIKNYKLPVLSAIFFKLALCRIVLEDVRDRDNHPAISAALEALNIEETAAGVTRLGKQFTCLQTKLITHRLESSADERTPSIPGH